MIEAQGLLQAEGMAEEEAIIEREVDEIIARVLELGEGDIALGAVRSFEAGVLDIPFAPSSWTRGRVIPVRDRKGAIRILRFGGLPFSEEVKEYHSAKVKERGAAERREPGFRMVIDDIYAISKGRLVGKPR